MPLLSIAENIFLGNEPAKMRRHRLGRRPSAAPASCCAKVGLKESPEHADHQSRRRQAAAGRDRQGAVQEGQAADPRRADREPQRDRQRRAARPAARVQGAGHHLDPDLAQAQRDSPRSPTRSPCCATAPRSRRSTAAPRRSARTASSRAWSAARCRDRYPHARAARSATSCSRSATGASTIRMHAGREVIKGVNLHVNARRGRRHRRPDGRRAHRTGDERVRPRLWPQHHAAQALMQRPAESTSRPIQKAIAARHRLRHRGSQERSGLILNEDIKNNVTLANLAGVAWHGVIDDAQRGAGRQPLSRHAEHPLLRHPASRRSTCRAATSRRWC